MHPDEVLTQRKNKWWLDNFLPGNFRQRGNKFESIRLVLLIIAMLGTVLFSLVFAVQSLTLPISLLGKFSSCILPFISTIILLHALLAGQYRQSALIFALVAIPFVLLHALSLQTLYIGWFYWIPWLITFVSFLGGRQQGLLVGFFTLLSTLAFLQMIGIHSDDMGAYPIFSRLFLQIVEHQMFALMAITIFMFTFALYSEWLELELQRQHASKIQTSQRTIIGQTIGNLAHEINNPLAIVHSALLHYQSLLQAKRLEKTMQHGLIQRVEHALKRLRLAIEALNNSVKSNNHPPMPAQAGNSQMKLISPGSLSVDRRRRHFFPKLTRLSIDVIDMMLPRITRSWPVYQRFNARTTVLICTIGLIVSLSNIFILHSEEVAATTLAIGYSILIFCLAALLALRFITRLQVMGIAYIMLLFSLIVIVAITHGQSILEPDLHWFPIMIVELFLVTRPRIALFCSIVILIGNALLMNHLQTFGLSLPFAQTFPQYRMHLQSTLIMVNFTTIVLSGAFISLMNSTHLHLKEEKDWQLYSIRMRELSELADSAGILIEDPLRRLEQLFRELETDGNNLSHLKDMLAQVERITRVSQSFALLFRTNAHEDTQSLEGKIWLEHIQQICSRRAADAGWALTTSLEPADLVLTGPLGRLTILVIICLQEAFAQSALEPQSPLHLEVKMQENDLVMRIRYAESPPSNKSIDQQTRTEEEMRSSLQQELLDSLQASLEYMREGKQSVCEIRWDPSSWKI